MPLQTFVSKLITNAQRRGDIIESQTNQNRPKMSVCMQKALEFHIFNEITNRQALGMNMIPMGNVY